MLPFFCAYDPYSMKTTPLRFELSQEMTAVVSFSQPLSLCEFGLLALTVKTAFKRSTPKQNRNSAQLIVTSDPTRKL